MPKKTEAIQLFLQGASSPLAKLYSWNMECQVNVIKGNGILSEEKEFKSHKWREYIDPITQETWKPIRIPFNSGTIAEYTDSEIGFDLYKYAQAVGMTGWDWNSGESHWVGYDVDSILNHEGGISDEDMKEVEERASKVPWVNLYRSTSGKGFHLYVFFEEPVKTANHNEHAALARSLLSPLTVSMGINFQAKVDCVGSILWVWHTDQVKNGLQLVSKGSKYPTSLIPHNWKEHIPVIRDRKQRMKPDSKEFAKLFASIKSVKLDEYHHNLLKWFIHAKGIYWWDNDYSRLVCHTYDLLTAHKTMDLKGQFATNSKDVGDGVQNCYCYPLFNGGWTVRRFGINTTEHESWERDSTGWTKCYFNCPPTFNQTMKFYGGIENEKGAFVFPNYTTSLDALSDLGIHMDVEDLPLEKISFKKKGNKITVKIDKDKNKNTQVSGFIRNSTNYEKTFYSNEVEEIKDNILPDNVIRHVVANGEDAGWYLNIKSNWIAHVKADIKDALAVVMNGAKKPEKDDFIGQTLMDPWNLVNKPFQSEYTGDRDWNKDSAQFAVEPLEGKFTTWVKLLKHIGQGIDEAVSKEEWCQKYSILNGVDYLTMWITFMFRRPEESLPYLFLYSSAFNTGKTTFWEALKLFFKNKNGFARIDQALTNPSGWNDELATAVLGVVEETNLKGDKKAFAKIKDWVTGTVIPINTRFKSTYDSKNTLHIIHTSNEATDCPIFPGDNRISVIEVPILDSEIPKTDFLSMLKEELPYFLFYILSIDLPPIHSRLAIPCLNTKIKGEIQETNMNLVLQYLNENTHYIEGEMLLIEELITYIHVWIMNQFSRETWDKKRIKKAIPQSVEQPIGKFGEENKKYIGNISLSPDDLDQTFKYRLENGRLKKWNT